MTTETTEVIPPVVPPVVAAPLNLDKPGATPPAVIPANPAATDPVIPEPKGDEVVPVVYNTTGDPGLDMVLKFVGDLGYSPENPAMAAAMQGDFALLEAELAAKGVKGHEAYIKLGQKAFTDTRSKTEARQKADREAVENEVGGAENWKAIQGWASANADDTERAELGAALKAGGLQARMAASWLKTNYDRANGVSDEGPGRTVATAKGAPDNTGALSPREYGVAVAKARVGFKGDFENSAVYKQLQARRMAFRG
jgi:hypothetical protein